MAEEAPPRPLLELEDVRKAFGHVVVADGFSLTLGRGEILGVVGPNGAGKTSVLNLVTGAVPPDGGRVILDGTEITRLPVHARARLGIARTFQIPRPFGGLTVFENVLVGATFAGVSRGDGLDPTAGSLYAIARADLLGKANVEAASLALLDRKRLELARALATHPRVLLLDEIAGGLTEPEVEDLVGTIRGLRDEGVAVVWIEHIVEALLSVVDRLVAMSFGRKLADGEPRSVIADPDVRAVYLGTKASA